MTSHVMMTSWDEIASETTKHTKLNMRFTLLVLVLCASLAFAHESCCNKKAQGEPELIPDPDDPWTEMIEDLTVTAPPGKTLLRQTLKPCSGTHTHYGTKPHTAANRHLLHVQTEARTRPSHCCLPGSKATWCLTLLHSP